MILPLEALALIVSDMAERNDIFLVDEFIEYLDGMGGFIEINLKGFDEE